MKVTIFGSVRGTADSGNDAFEATTGLGASFKATDAKGDVIENNDGVARSEQITLTAYSDSPYSTKMLRTIDMLPFCIAIVGQLPFQAFLLENTHSL